MRGLLLALMLIGLLFAGCVDDEAIPPADPDMQADADTGPEDGLGDTPVVDPDAPRAEAPDWRPGDWWTWDVTPRDSPAYQATTAVARTDANGYEIGWGAVDEGLRSQFFHFIPNGPVSRDLVWEGHHEPIDWFDFPLVDGKTWTGGVWQAELEFVATAAEIPTPSGAADGFLVMGSGREGNIRVELEWAPGIGMFTGMRYYLFDEVPWLSLVLKEYGSDRTEPIHLLHSDMTFATFTSLEHVVHSTAPPPAVERLQVPADVTHVAMGCYLGGPPGYYSYRFTDSAQTSYDCEAHVSDQWFGALIAYGPIVPGEATSSFVTAGQGSVFTELYLARAEAVTPE